MDTSFFQIVILFFSIIIILTIFGLIQWIVISTFVVIYTLSDIKKWSQGVDP